ncbi:MFS transporter [Micromonospora sp. KC721]|uniref:MFS transporter n=1 Tax=Micromonospora sp. KC721 TaxID=2530380 RepID=UPI001404BD3B|nr:MFS transporter [Micromonospora sp. KC721]
MTESTLKPRQVAYAAMAGTAFETYEYFLYGFVAATVFGPIFFPAFHPWLGTLAAVSSHAVAFLVRPLGAVLFGRIGDRLGRRPALITSLTLMGAATIGVGLLPTYAAIGVTAPILLVVLRLVQGLSVGGEIPGAVLVGVEYAPPNRRNFFGAFAYIGVTVGFLIVSVSLLLVTTVVGAETFQSWGWRIPFLFSAVLLVFGLVLRTRLAETPEFVAAESRIRRERAAGRLRTLFRGWGRPLLGAILIWIGPSTFFYAFLTSLLAYTKNFVPELRTTTVQWALLLTAIALTVIATVAAYYGDRANRIRMIIIAGIWWTLWAAPSYLLVETGSAPALFTAMLVGVVPQAIVTGVAPALTADLFPVEVRYLGLAVALTLSVLIGGLLPIPALALVGAADGSVVPMIVVMLLAGIAVIVGAFMIRRLQAKPAAGQTPAGRPAR